MRRIAVAAILAALWLVVMAPAVSADPPGPTNFKSEVAEVDPPQAGIDIEIVGGDSFLLLRASEGLTVEVIGYQGEPYLRYLPDGTVEENAASPSKYLNEERYGGDLPPEADADAPPRWEIVANDGSFAWHDHRTHWMNSQPPPGLGPGDQVAEGVVPLLLNGVEVDVTVVSIWQDPPSSAPVTVGIIAGAGLGYAAIRRRRTVLIPIVLTLALMASVVGLVAYRSVPAETGPAWSLWVLPVTALLLVSLAALARRLGDTIVRHRTMMVLIASLELMAWGVAHWGWLWPAIIPTALPFWLDRLASSTVLLGATGAAAATLAAATTPAAELGGG